ncbi:hypothetical protein JYU34_013869 [Plutella xylostella]|uniref:Uncharacterized protein n=1 Tax=Plutella xylostella TaxID=51655 RepID=A0ABQ7QAW0_PLUXY|nr:hypothetical protein JYU34_013869 [Plutella xylostella]
MAVNSSTITALCLIALLASASALPCRTCGTSPPNNSPNNGQKPTHNSAPAGPTYQKSGNRIVNVEDNKFNILTDPFSHFIG